MELFNQSIGPNVLPNSLSSLKLGFHFNHPLNNLPYNLKNLQLRNYIQSIQNIVLPNSLTHLEINGNIIINKN